MDLGFIIGTGAVVVLLVLYIRLSRHYFDKRRADIAESKGVAPEDVPPEEAGFMSDSEMDASHHKDD